MTELTADEVEVLVNKNRLTLAMLRYWDNLPDHTQQFFREAAEQRLKKPAPDTPVHYRESALLATAVELAYSAPARSEKETSPTKAPSQEERTRQRGPKQTAEGLLRTRPGHVYQKYLQQQWAAFNTAPKWKAPKRKFIQALRSKVHNFSYLHTATRTIKAGIKVRAVMAPHLN